ncbi:SRPBCC family protein [Mycobacterium sp. NPDC006124]|uniref:SRPBCC family protein n=1 Tax=Mycobacterium sp. NPDC006124 TaxID=3156729 RepID=UPI0033A8DC69
MTYDTTVDSLHVSQLIDADAAEVYEFAADPANLPRWAAGLADPQLATAKVDFAPRNEFGVLDHVVTLPDGSRFYNPMRVIPAGLDRRGCEVVFTVRRFAGVTDEQFAADAAAVATDLATLRDVLEKTA